MLEMEVTGRTSDFRLLLLRGHHCYLLRGIYYEMSWEVGYMYRAVLRLGGNAVAMDDKSDISRVIC
jgi:hypothetical protein